MGLVYIVLYFWCWILASVSQVFSGNNDEDTLVENFLPTPIKAMFIRIQPTKWYKWVSMRFGVSGCDTSGMFTTQLVDILTKLYG